MPSAAVFLLVALIAGALGFAGWWWAWWVLGLREDTERDRERP